MTGGPAPHSQSREPEKPRSRAVHVNAVNIFASDPNREPLDFGDDEENDEPVDNLAAPVGIITAVVIGVLLWVVIILVIFWLK